MDITIRKGGADDIPAILAILDSLTGIQDTRQGSDARVLLEFGRAGEMLSREDALLTVAHLTGRFSEEGLRAFSGAVETRRTLTASATADLPAADRAAWDRLAAGGDHARLTRAEDRIRAESPGRTAAQAVPSADWDDTLAAVRNGLAAIETDARTAAADRSDPFAGGVAAVRRASAEGRAGPGGGAGGRGGHPRRGLAGRRAAGRGPSPP
ncbi:nitrate- and nitrite sensing domain-containing protein, partial [Streptomyces massasporeus]